jgi:hypothetical protein
MNNYRCQLSQWKSAEHMAPFYLHGMFLCSSRVKRNLNDLDLATAFWPVRNKWKQAFRSQANICSCCIQNTPSKHLRSHWNMGRGHHTRRVHCSLTVQSHNHFLFGCVGVWTQGITLARQALLTLKPLHQPFLALGIFEIGSCEVFTLTGFKPWSSWPLPPK